ncbi:hypothetical protein [Akkermansia sp.]|uniref:hypothetical protein n=1 Tax=Akkermansia sp. TaxID=1872421 RepID=UPI0025C330DF|nr:hypothetical protein [Akkermansia sp.]MCC8147691.1 hypothetical protein [Akkermansia sp.]
MQMRYVLFPFMAALCLTPAACSVTYGNKSVASPAVYGALTPGKSVKTDVYDALGQPSDVVTMEKGVLWTYRYRKAKNNLLGNVPLFGVNLIAGGKNGDVYTVLALFDRKGVLASRSSEQKKLYTSNLASLKRTLDGMIEDDSSHQRVEAEMKKIGRPFDPDAAKEAMLLEKSLD